MHLCICTLLPTIYLFSLNSFVTKAPCLSVVFKLYSNPLGSACVCQQFSLGQTHSEINTVGACCINVKYPLVFKSNIEHTHTHPNNSNIICNVI